MDTSKDRTQPIDFATAPTADQSGELMRRAVMGLPVTRIDALRAYSNPANWKQVYAPGDDGKPRCYWAWVGPVIVGYELAGTALGHTKRRIG